MKRLVMLLGCMVAGLSGAMANAAGYPAESSQVEWTRAHQGQVDEWPKGDGVQICPGDRFDPQCDPNDDPDNTKYRGVHTLNNQSTCTGASCHPNGPGTSPIVYPERPNCATGSCHGWLGDVDQSGYPNVYSDAGVEPLQSYQGSIHPYQLLQEAKDVDGDGRHHTAIFNKWGCQGFCHNPNMTLEIAEAYGKDGVEPTATELPPGTDHGYISTCTQCHAYRWLGGEDPTLHTIHAVLVGAEKVFADTSGTADTSCDYCHNLSQRSPGGCYNCHLSGHQPETHYWSFEPQAVHDAEAALEELMAGAPPPPAE